MKNFIVCVAFFVVALGLSNVTMANDCKSPVRDRVACIGCRAKIATQRVSKGLRCQVQKAKCQTAKAVKSVSKMPMKARCGVKRALQNRPKMIRCCEVSSVEIGAAMVPAVLIIPVAEMPQVDDLAIFDEN
jgi:hypothetical protein